MGRNHEESDKKMNRSLEVDASEYREIMVLPCCCVAVVGELLGNVKYKLVQCANDGLPSLSLLESHHMHRRKVSKPSQSQPTRSTYYYYYGNHLSGLGLGRLVEKCRLRERRKHACMQAG